MSANCQSQNSSAKRFFKNSQVFGLVFLLLLVSVVVNVSSQSTVSSEDAGKVLTQTPIKDADGYLQLTFPYLSSYDYPMPSEEDVEQKNFGDHIPPHIKELQGQKIVIDGFLLPSDFEGKKLKRLVLFNTYLGCCFGSIPGMNEWIYVTMIEAQPFQYFHGMPIKVYGTLEVGENVDDDGGLSLYRMQGHRIESHLPAKKWWQFWR
jgi:hypothetical protein